VRTIDTEAVSARYRERAIDTAGRRLLITNYNGTGQEQDLSEPANCQGFGRIRHFRRHGSRGWLDNSLPIDPAGHALGLPPADLLRAQVFQNAVCNWRCWYCFVPFDLLSANRQHSSWLSTDELVQLYLDEPNPPQMIDLSGGQPDLTPEWVPWMMESLEKRGIAEQVYLWSDDNLSNDFFWRHLTRHDQHHVANYPKYGRVCCFKGYNSASFQFNTLAEASLFDEQFSLMRRLLALGLDLYAYVTLTTPDVMTLEADMRLFVDRLQAIHTNLPLRTVPLEIQVFTPVTSRVKNSHQQALKLQYQALEAWQAELQRRYSSSELSQHIALVSIN
jgi:uncharacterized Fe-S cluster-containing radical SAM superfamily protein